MIDYRKIGAIALAGLLGGLLFVMFPRERPRNRMPPATSTSASSREEVPMKPSGSVIVEQSQLSEQDFREYAALFEPLDKSRKVIEVFESGQSMLCDEQADGSMGLTFLTVKSLAGEKGQAVIVIEQNTMLLPKDGEAIDVISPSIVIRDFQKGEVSITGSDGGEYSLGVEGFHLGDDKIQLAVEFRGAPVAASKNSDQ
ncbi:MAG: hypothetical protein GXP30_01735 [Verrucomicrobia bacterium]|nr:hypothetical protein [Verrucomicrobiota bacterium]